MRYHRLGLLLVALTCWGCGGSTGNPFASFTRSELPSPGTDLIFVSNLHDPASPLREVFALDLDAGEPQQLTFCNRPGTVCDAVIADLAPDRTRLAVARTDGDRDGDGDLDADDGVTLYVVDLERSIDSEFVEATARASGVEWSPTANLLIYTARTPLGPGAPGIGGADLYRVSGSRTELFNLTQTPELLERGVRLDPGGRVALFERTAPIGAGVDLAGALVDPVGLSQVWFFQDSNVQVQLSEPVETGPRLPGSPYLIGSDANPVFSPDSAQVAFRRLKGAGSGDGVWELFAVSLEDETLAERPLLTGDAYRSAPDWSSRGLLFSERDGSSTRLMVLDPATGSVEVLLTAPASVRIEHPRWLAP
jgi:hypothetical protein